MHWDCTEGLEVGQTRGNCRVVWEPDSRYKECSRSVGFLVTEVNEDLGCDGILLLVFQGEVEDSWEL